jgi:ketol-acid reductoisomerase
VITSETKEIMKEILKEVESGQFAKEFIDEYEQNNFKKMLQMRKSEGDHPVEVVGRRIRSMFQKN